MFSWKRIGMALTAFLVLAVALPVYAQVVDVAVEGVSVSVVSDSALSEAVEGSTSIRVKDLTPDQREKLKTLAHENAASKTHLDKFMVEVKRFKQARPQVVAKPVRVKHLEDLERLADHRANIQNRVVAIRKLSADDAQRAPLEEELRVAAIGAVRDHRLALEHVRPFLSESERTALDARLAETELSDSAKEAEIADAALRLRAAAWHAKPNARLNSLKGVVARLEAVVDKINRVDRRIAEAADGMELSGRNVSQLRELLSKDKELVDKINEYVEGLRAKIAEAESVEGEERHRILLEAWTLAKEAHGLVKEKKELFQEFRHRFDRLRERSDDRPLPATQIRVLRPTSEALVSVRENARAEVEVVRSVEVVEQLDGVEAEVEVEIENGEDSE